LKSGSLNLLEPSGPVQVCNGIALITAFLDENCIGKNAEENLPENYLTNLSLYFALN
jgi:hypothetical protein